MSTAPTWTPPPPHILALPGRISGDKDIPFNQQAEEAVIGSLLIDRDAIFQIRPILAPDDFFFADTLGAVYGAVGELADRAVPADLVTLADHLARRGLLERIGGPGTLTAWQWATPTASHVVYYARIVAEYAQVRRLISEGGTVAGLGYDTSRPAADVLAEARERIMDATLPRDDQGLRPISQVAADLRETIFAPRTHPGQLRGVPTSLPWLDALTGGFQKQNVYMLAARPGAGKTSLMTQVAGHNARQRRGV
jgi:replicative DNA helicase